MVRGLPTPSAVASGTDNQSSATPTQIPGMGQGSTRPPDFTNPQQLLGASPALLEGKLIRGGMGTGMPYWGPIFTDPQLQAIISYLYTFAWNSTSGYHPVPSPGQSSHP